jgi:hypothetical protein
VRQLSVARWAAAAASGVALLSACASMAAPPGGPEDKSPPVVVSVSPDSGAVNFHGRAVEFRFDEVVSDRGTGPGALDQLVVISPREGAPRVAWHRDAIAVRPRSGWRANTAYTVTLLPGIADIRGNATKTPRTIVFSTGAELPQLAIRGRVFDWLAERPAARAVVEAISRPDSSVYVTMTDSLGAFTVAPLAAGLYTVRGFIDQNGNRALDRGEAWDSVSTRPPRAGVQTSIELLAAPRDTLPPRMSNVAVVDSVTLGVEFDRPLDPRQQITPGLFAIARADSSPVAVRDALPRREFDRQEAARRAAADTARAGRQPPEPAHAVRAAAAALTPSQPPPPTQVVLRLGAPLAPGSSYRITATGLRNLLGRTGTSTRVLEVPRPAPADTTRVPANRRPGTPP